MRLPSEPVRNTCPDIDRLQKIINGLKDDFGSFKEHDSTDDFLTSMNNACWELRDIYDTLEDLRNSNSALRDWGHELTSLAEEMENEKDAEISEKEVEIENLELCWSVPFSTLFEEQEYIKEGSYEFFLSDGFKTDEVNNTSVLYEKRHFEVTAKKSLKNSAKELKQQKINILNKVFDENYK